MNELETYADEAVRLLRRTVPIRALSTEEKERSDFLFGYLQSKGASPVRHGLNIICRCGAGRGRSVLLDAHIDTVPPSAGYTRDPFSPGSDGQTVFGLGSNDDGGSVVSMIQTFLYFNDRPENLAGLGFDLTLCLTVEEERIGRDGIRSLAPYLKDAVFAIIGEPTGMKAAVGERGLLVVDAVAFGKSGHAARDEGVNALYIALDDIEKVRGFKFDKVSPAMGEVKMTVTQINAGTRHNIVPDRCDWVIDIRPTDAVSPAEIMGILKKELKSTLTARSLDHDSSCTPAGHPVFDALEKAWIVTYVSPTTSDWTLTKVPAVKLGPGESSRSHRPDEFIKVSEINGAVETYINLIEKLKL